jgi:hypothetical protein
MEAGRVIKANNRLQRDRLHDGHVRGDEPQEVERAACRCPQDDRGGQRPVDRRPRQGLGPARRGGPRVQPEPRQHDRPLSASENARWKKAVLPIMDSYVKEVSAKGLPAQKAVKEVEELIKRYSKIYK